MYPDTERRLPSRIQEVYSIELHNGLTVIIKISKEDISVDVPDNKFRPALDGVVGAGEGGSSEPEIASTQGSCSIRVKLLQAFAVPSLIPLPSSVLPAIEKKSTAHSPGQATQGVNSHCGGGPFVSEFVPAVHTSEHADTIAAP